MTTPTTERRSTGTGIGTASPTAAELATTGTSATAATAAASTGGSTRIAETVVSKIAGLAAREVSGVHALGGGAARTFGSLRERIPGASSNVSQGVSVEVGERQAAVDLDLVVEYGVSIADLARTIRRNVISALERMTGLEVVEVNISVGDVHIPSADDDREPAQVSSARVA